MTPQVSNRLLWQRSNGLQNRRTGCPVRGERKGTVELTLGNAVVICRPSELTLTRVVSCKASSGVQPNCFAVAGYPASF